MLCSKTHMLYFEKVLQDRSGYSQQTWKSMCQFSQTRINIILFRASSSPASILKYIHLSNSLVGVEDPTEVLFEAEELLEPLLGFQDLTTLCLSFPNITTDFITRLITSLKSLQNLVILSNQFVTKAFQNAVFDKHRVAISFFQ
ncbi:hypothetical protein K493DRAFT_11934 [Basidiobolus meristosporus CBS 931.73]|uniref:F-box domain-containing protein n=1 Tax=Basidiobolus meristosporus CBS 931.73 TaxID=1314790 RepID=A0A1Y1VRE7_9FUNG|nr:hypothetical protein K493DRAFT_11934 [Basidiobolus meristosporus CBS 931.73]|eukprot:ORX63858.1 hypothetical protein K493DRAFT_11934 [Basidiobolus meristosporus CBS 931.73]